MDEFQEIDLVLARMDAEIERRGPPKPIATVFVALHTSSGVEVSGQGYERQPFAHTTTFKSTGNWGRVQYAAIYDHEGTLLAEMPLALGAVPLAGDTVQVALNFGSKPPWET